jgi:flavin-dependent dehydrogenase
VIDVCVAGGGPAGLATALHCARRGLSTVVLEPRRGPVDKACGEGLMPAAALALGELVGPGVLSGMPLRGIRYLDAEGASVEAPFRHGAGLGVRRTTLHAALAAAVDAAGIPVLPLRVDAVEQSDDHIRAGGITARYLVAADGLHSPLRRALGLDRPDSRPPRYGLRQHFHAEPWTDLVEVHWAARAEAYVTPVGSAQIGVALLSSDRQPWAAHLRQFPRLLDRLGSPVASRVRGAGPLRQRAAARRAGRVLLVGDAAGYVDALTGEGLAVAVASARVLADCLAEDRPQDYEAAWRRESRRSRVLTETLLWAAGRPAVRSALVPSARRLPAVFGTVVNLLAGQGPARVPTPRSSDRSSIRG